MASHRHQVLELVDIFALDQAWDLCKQIVGKDSSEWSSIYQYCRIAWLMDRNNATPILERLSQGGVVMTAAVLLLKAECLSHLKRWSELLELSKTVPVSVDFSDRWAVHVDDELLRERMKHYRTLAKRRLYMFGEENLPTERSCLYQLFEQEKYQEAYNQTRDLLKCPMGICDRDLVTLHVSLLAQLSLVPELYSLGHRLVSLYPSHAMTWYCVALYYQSCQKPDQARRYFLKACSKDEHYAPAWIAMGHEFAQSGEHDQAVSAYAHVLRKICPEMIEPAIFLASEYLRVKQPIQATSYLLTICNAHPTSPSILNELAVLYVLQKTHLKALSVLQSIPEKTVANRINLAMVMLRLNTFTSLQILQALKPVSLLMDSNMLVLYSFILELVYYEFGAKQALVDAFDVIRAVLKRNQHLKVAKSAFERVQKIL